MQQLKPPSHLQQKHPLRLTTRWSRPGQLRRIGFDV